MMKVTSSLGLDAASTLPPPVPVAASAPPPAMAVVTAADDAPASTTHLWLERIRDTQLRRLSPEEREMIQRKAAEKQQWAKSAHVSHGCHLRSKHAVCNTVQSVSISHHAPPQAQADVVLQSFQRAEAGEQQLISLPPPVDAAAEHAQEGLVQETAVEDIHSVLASLEKEPKDNEQCAAKFQLYEKFSETLAAIRTSLDDVVRQALEAMPQGPRQGVLSEMAELESAAHRGVFDESRFWVVHDMMSQGIKNAKLIEEISKKIQLRLKMLADAAQTQCPICLEAFDATNVVPHLLMCCHTVCKSCWEQWAAVRHGNVFCPLCRNRDFLDYLVEVGNA